MNLYKFLQNEHPSFGARLIGAACFSGVVNGILAGILVTAANNAKANDLNFQFFLFFALALGAFIYSKKYTLDKTAEIVEAVLEKIRLRIAGKIRGTDLQNFNSIGSSPLYTALTVDTQMISQTSGQIINAASSMIMVLIASIFIFFLSPLAFFMTVGMIGIIIGFYFNRRNKLNDSLTKATQMENDYFDALNDLLSGFKQLKLNSNKSEDFFETRIQKLSNEVVDLKISTTKSFNQVSILSQIFFYVLLGGIVFILPSISPDQADTVVGITSIILFIVGPITEVVGLGPSLAKTTVAIKNIYAIEQRLDSNENKSGQQPQTKQVAKYKPEFKELKCVGCKYSYPNADGHHSFKLGPIDFELKAGEVVFVVGGNGSGKSTFMNVLTSLFPLVEGSIYLNGRVLTDGEIQGYRDLFSTIFTDFHLFDRLYGVENYDQEEADALIRAMEIDHVTSICDKQITNRNLSTGQKKRLALALTRIEDKPIFIFDEWAADQDPQFRKYFYNEIIPELKRKGKTIVAVTHDDHYFSAADRIIKLEFGSVVPFQP